MLIDKERKITSGFQSKGPRFPGVKGFGGGGGGGGAVSYLYILQNRNQETRKRGVVLYNASRNVN